MRIGIGLGIGGRRRGNQNEARLQSARSLLVDAKSGAKTDVTYIVAGDSTRDNTYNEMIPYYRHQFRKLNVAVVDSAESGQSGQNWLNGVGSVTMAQAIAASPGTGATTILEYSFGLNDDKNGATRAQVKGWLTDGITGFLAAKPDASVVLVVPVYTSVLSRNTNLQGIYYEIAAELGLPIIDPLSATEAVWGNPDFYFDGTHPNKAGSVRLLNFIADKLLPASLYDDMFLDQYFLTPGAPPSEMAMPVESGYWATSTGGPTADANWRRMQSVAVEPNFNLRTQHQGNRNEIMFMDAGGAFISKVTPATVSGQPYKLSTIPAGAVEALINISSNGATYDALGDVPSVKYDQGPAAALTMAEINAGLSIRLLDLSVGQPLPANIVTNPGGPFTTTTSWTGQGCDLAVESGRIVATSLDGSSDRVEYALSGLTIGRTYRVEMSVIALQGASVRIGTWTWATISPAIVIPTVETTYVFYLTATATSGVSRFYAAQSGAAGDKVGVSYFDVRDMGP